MVILAEFGQDWYFGHTVANEAHKGIFPRDFVYITSSARAVESQEPLVEEINSSLKEWNAIMKTKYVNFDNLEVNIIVGKISKCIIKSYQSFVRYRWAWLGWAGLR